MRASIITALAAACLCAASVASAGDPAGSPSILVPRAGGVGSSLLGGFFDTSRLHMSNSFVVSSGFSSGVGSTTRGMAFTTLAYDVSNPLTASVTFGNRLFGAPRWQGDSGRMTLEALSLKYKPNNNFSMTIHMANRDPFLYPYAP